MDAHNHILCEQRDSVFIIQLNRPEKKHAITRQMYQSLTQAMHEAAHKDDIRAVIITGSEDCFTAGNDLSDFIHAKTMQDLEPVLQFLMYLPKFNKPLIAAVHGLAIGIGTTMLLHCDIVIADETSQFQLPFINLGACPEAGSSVLLPLLCGHQKASELLLLGERFDIKTANQLNLINHITPARKALDKALDIANHLAKKSPRAVQLTKSLLKKSYIDQLSAVIGHEAKSFFECLQSKEAQQALQAFFANK